MTKFYVRDQAGGNVLKDLRLRLSAPQNFYVRADGNDANTGLANTPGDAWLTVQFAFDYIYANIDAAYQVLNLNIADGVYAGGAQLRGKVTGTSISNPLNIVGNTTTPTNVALAGGADVAIRNYGGHISLSGVSLSGLYGVTTYYGGTTFISGKCNFSTCSNAQLAILYGGTVEVLVDYTINGSAPVHIQSTMNSSYVSIGHGITLVGAPVFSAGMLVADTGGAIRMYSITITGPIGLGSKQYSAVTAGGIDTAGTWTVPGAVAGTVIAPGWFT